MRVILFMCVALLVSPVFAKEEKRKCKMGRDYWLYTPDTIDKNKTYWLVVGVHGHRGKGAGAAGLAKWIKKYDNIIVVGPTFPSTNPYYQILGGNSDKQLLDIQKNLSKEFKLHEKMFIYGFSGGSQFAHRFTEKHYKKVIGVSSHSGGTWNKGPSRSSASVVWTLSCGLKDTAHSAGAPLTRIEYFRNFYKAMNKGKFTAKPFVTNAGHSATSEVRSNTEECFRIATTGMFDYQREATKGMSVLDRENFIRKDFKLTEKEFNDGKNSYKLKVNKDGWTVSSTTLKAMSDTRKMLDRLKK